MPGSASRGSSSRRSSGRPPRATPCSPVAASIPRPRCRTCPSPRSSGSSWRAGPSSSPHTRSWRGCCPGHVSGEAVDRELGQLRVFDAMLSALDSLSVEAPALLVLEDLHWADRSSRDLLVFLLSRLTAQRLVVLATYRTDDLHRRHPLRPVLSELVRLPAVERLDLAPLDAGDTLDLVQRLANGSLSDDAGAPGRRAQRGQRVLRRRAGLGLVRRAAQRARRGVDGPDRGPAADHPAGAAAGRGRRAPGRARAARGRVRAARRRAGAGPARCRRPPRAGGRTRRRRLRVPARAAARGHLHRAAARRAQQAARPLRPAVRRARRGGERGGRARPPRDGGPRPAARAGRLGAGRAGGRSPRRARRGAAARRARAGAVGRGARRPSRSPA